MEENEEKDVEELEEKKGFWKSRKNIAIVILSILLFFSIGSGGENNTTQNTLNNEVARLTDQVKVLEARNEKLGKSLNEFSLEVVDTTDYKNQIASLETKVGELEEKNSSLEEELNKAKEENEKLSKELKSKSTTTTKSSTSTSSAVTQTQSTTTSATPTVTAVSAPVESSTSNSYTVYVTNTGAKYHRAGCRYLKQSQNPISKDDAVAQGYTACSVCKP